ncbi:hypothetical protein FA13DRAFT_1715480 [Coprinellus micaceus]|uniref:Uncharacterized protein n=1 Tax=Coprinellus micaceus TaxID=71717 RepID=A0A4Y7SPQ9_COPMI|nr:hypothetical protein FA13DRAFT_1715480 [Coprinellus micaceus]
MAEDGSDGRNSRLNDYPRDIAPPGADDAASLEPEDPSGAIIVLSIEASDSDAAPSAPPPGTTASLTGNTVIIAPVIVAPGAAANGAGAAPAQPPALPSSTNPAATSAKQMQPIPTSDPSVWRLQVSRNPASPGLRNMLGNAVTALGHTQSPAPSQPASQTTPASGPPQAPRTMPDGTQAGVVPSGFDKFVGTLTQVQTTQLVSSKNQLQFHRSQNRRFRDELEAAETPQGYESGYESDTSSTGSTTTTNSTASNPVSLYTVYSTGWDSKRDHGDGGAGGAGSAGAVVQVV